MAKQYLDGSEVHKKHYWRVTPSTTIKDLVESGGTKVIVDPETFVSDCLNLEFVAVPEDLGHYALNKYSKIVLGIRGLAFSLEVFPGHEAAGIPARVTFIYHDWDSYEFYHITATAK